jgi:nucleotide-binding universal stress UspA family protein
MSFRPSRILVPLDGSKLAEAVIPAAFGLAEALDAPVTLLHVLERRPPPTVHGEPHLRTVPDASEYLERVARWGRDAGVRVDVHTHEQGVKDVAAAIAEHARELDCALIALCTHGRGGVKGLLLGSIAQQTLRRGEASVLLVRPVPGEGLPFWGGSVTVAFDPKSRHGGAALDAAGEVAHACHGTVRLLAVVPTARSLPPARQATRTLLPHVLKAVLDLEERDALRALREATATLEQHRVESRSEVLRGDPVVQISAALREETRGLLVVATHGRSGLGGWMEGSFAPRITSPARRPSLPVRADGRAARPPGAFLRQPAQPAIPATTASIPSRKSPRKRGRTKRSQRSYLTPAAMSTAISAPLVGVRSSVSPAPYW